VPKWPKIRKQNEDDVVDYPHDKAWPGRYDEKGPAKSNFPAGIYIPVGGKTWQIKNKKLGKREK